MRDRQNGYGMSVSISLHLLKRKQYHAFGSQENPTCWTACWVFAAHHTIIFFVTKITWMLIDTFSLLSLNLFPSLDAHSQWKNDTDATFTQLLALPSKVSAGISWSYSLYKRLISPVTKDRAGKENLWPFLGNPESPVSKVLLCTITNYWIFFWRAWVLRVRFSLDHPVSEMHPEDICFESSIYFV